MPKAHAKTDPDIQEGLAAIDAWEQWFRTAQEERLRACPDTHLVEAQRAQVEAIVEAYTAECRAHLARKKR